MWTFQNPEVPIRLGRSAFAVFLPPNTCSGIVGVMGVTILPTEVNPRIRSVDWTRALLDMIVVSSNR